MIAEIIADFQANMWLYISIPFVSGIIGYVTKVVAIQMMFLPMDFIGFKIFGIPIGWQGIVPRKAEKMATISVDLMTSRLINANEVFARLDPQRIAKEIEGPMTAAAEEITRSVAQQYQPGLWEMLPDFARQKIIKKMQTEAPQVVANIMSEIQGDVEKYFDIKHMVISNLLKDRKMLNEIFQKVGKQEFRFFSNAGFWFGLSIGVIQMICWLLFKQPWMLPAFGGFVGFFSDWAALQMMFRPLEPKKIMGFTFQGLFIKRQHEVARDYAALISKQLLTPSNMMEELFRGPLSDRIMELIHRNVREMIDAQTGSIRPLVVYAVGSQKYIEMKAMVTQKILEKLPETMKHMESYAEDAMDIRNTLVDRMQKLTPSEFEGMLRPAFKEDEWALIAVGAILGFIVGELQIQFMIH
ncbi:DUF445 domain-containing protein [Agitococcus lubricus]|uniref:Uncharacterized membrane protein YheB (UPF0754 family) n=1 Tax=Agitococcus lubricus TaxID=1077255 RepID=A0A2T5IYF7_9GAMM|nr:DUF445 family protein [Agitococcus lubricus]PTQ89010.1 uncharacterized membrane protein YheB (UPF0754 family) [Agitococcus lubricus]